MHLLAPLQRGLFHLPLSQLVDVLLIGNDAAQGGSDQCIGRFCILDLLLELSLLLREVIHSLLILHDFLHRGQLVLLHELLSLPLAHDEVLAIAED